MKIQSTFLVLFLCILFSIDSIAQSTVREWVMKGIELHDQGKFDQAIDAYNAALKIDKKSELALYEMSFSYMEKGDYKNAAKYSNKVIKIDGEHTLSAYIINGSALDMMGKTEKGIKILEQAAAEYPNEYLVYFNLGINYSKVGRNADAVGAFQSSIQNNPEHGSSHLSLAHLNLTLNQKSKAALSYYFFLLLESDTKRSDVAFANLNAIMNPPKNKSGGFNINLTLDEDNSDPIWTAADFIVSTMGLIKEEIDKEKGEEVPEMTEAQQFASNTNTFIGIFTDEDEEDQEKYKEQRQDLYWTLYIPIFTEIEKAEALEAFAYVIAQRQGTDYVNWLDENVNEAQKLLDLFK